MTSGVRIRIITLIVRFRRWLERNEIFIKTAQLIAFVILTWKAVEIASYQAELLKSEHLPILYPQVERLDSDEEQLVIYNKGYPIAGLKDCESIVFLKVVCWNRTGDLNLKMVLIPLLDYYSKPECTKNLTGKIVVFNPTKDNYWKITVVSFQFMEFIKNENKTGYITLARFIRIKYQDIDKEDHDEVYFVDETFGGYKLPNDIGKAILEYYYRQTLKQEGVHLKELTPDLIYSKWSEIEEVSFKILQYI